MNRFRMLLMAAAAAPSYAFAQSAPVMADPADARVAVAPPAYRSAFAGFRPADVPSASPDRLWLQANRIVAGAAAAPDDRSTAPVPPAPPQQKAGGHAGHHGHQTPMKGQ